jgi:hypothetical protein
MQLRVYSRVAFNLDVASGFGQEDDRLGTLMDLFSIFSAQEWSILLLLSVKIQLSCGDRKA